MDDARECIIEEVIDSSYGKAGLRASILDGVHKQTVKNITINIYFFTFLTHNKLTLSNINNNFIKTFIYGKI